MSAAAWAWAWALMVEDWVDEDVEDWVLAVGDEAVVEDEDGVLDDEAVLWVLLEEAEVSGNSTMDESSILCETIEKWKTEKHR